MKKSDRLNIAIIGTGISGLGVSYLLHPYHNITVYEKNSYIGGHSRTVQVTTPEGKIPVDTGFIVFNRRNYPLLSALFKHLKVETVKSRMSFGVSINAGWLEYSTQSPLCLFAQRNNMIRWQFWLMLVDILRFNRQSRRFIDAHPSMTLGEYLQASNLTEWFRNYYLLAMGGSIWSTSVAKMLEFPARTFLRFFDNHGLLSVTQQPQWYTVKNGSQAYVEKLTATFRDRIFLNRGIKKIIRHASKVAVIDNQENTNFFDHVILASHPDQALQMLAMPSKNERDILGAFSYQPNTMVLHSDRSFMPRAKKAWASWVYLAENSLDNNDVVSLSYWMNNLQSLPVETPIIVTLNPGREPSPELVYDRHTFEHPLFDQQSIAAQEKLPLIQGVDRLWYCGAYQRYGFHEDGLLSAVNIAKSFGVDVPWS